MKRQLHGKKEIEMKIFVDDIREAPKNYDKVFRTGEAFIEWLKLNPNTPITLLTLDHDLGENVMNGYELVKTFVEMPNHIICLQFHTDNLVGLKNMFYYAKNAKKHEMLPNIRIISPRKFIFIDGKASVHPTYTALLH